MKTPWPRFGSSSATSLGPLAVMITRPAAAREAVEELVVDARSPAWTRARTCARPRCRCSRCRAASRCARPPRARRSAGSRPSAAPWCRASPGSPSRGIRYFDSPSASFPARVHLRRAVPREVDQHHVVAPRAPREEVAERALDVEQRRLLRGGVRQEHHVVLRIAALRREELVHRLGVARGEPQLRDRAVVVLPDADDDRPPVRRSSARGGGGRRGADRGPRASPCARPATRCRPCRRR